MALSRSSQELVNSVIGENSFFSGRFHINGSLRINGSFEGRSLHTDQLYVGPTGKIKTNVKATSIIVEGMIIGNIEAGSRVMLLPTARIMGNIKTPELIIQNGVILEGQVTISTDLNMSAKERIEREFQQGFKPAIDFLQKKNQKKEVEK